MEVIKLDELYRCYDVETGRCTAKYGQEMIIKLDTFRNIVKISHRYYITRDLSEAFTDVTKQYMIRGMLTLYTVYYISGGLFISLDVPNPDLVYRRNGNTLEASDVVVRQGLPRWIPCGNSVVYIGEYSQFEVKNMPVWDFEYLIKANIKRL